MTRLRLFALALLSVGFTACLDTTAPNYATVENTTFASSLGVDLANSTKTDVGVYYRDVVLGTGTPVTEGQESYYYYRAYLSNGVEIDSLLPVMNGKATIPATIVPGSVPPQTIPGFEIGLQGMRVGGERQILVPPALAYGLDDIRGQDNNVLVPGNSVLVFEVYLVNADGSTTTAP